MIPYLIVAAVCSVVFFGAGMQYRKKVAESEIGQAENEARRILNVALKGAESKKKEALLEAKEEAIQLRAEAERELKERRTEALQQEKRLAQREATIEKRSETLEQKEEKVTQRLKEAETLKEEIESVKQQELEVLERISGLTLEQAKEFLLQNVESELKHEMALRVKEYEQRFREESEERAKEIITLAIQKYAADVVAEVTVSVVSLPNDEMKGRIIGREGRNIRAIETLTGVDLIIDDTPEAITISGFDPVRREVARIALERLVQDGRIHPAKIEEAVERTQRDIENTIKQEGERATFETGVFGLHPEMIKLLGRLRYRTSYGQNVLLHSIEVAHIAGIMAAEIGLDVQMAKRAGLLHDIGKALDHEIEGSHVEIGADVARKFKENEIVVNAIESHHGEVEPSSLISCLVQTADAISASRPGARRENLEAYIKRLEQLEAITNAVEGVERSYAIQAGREIRVMVRPEEISDADLALLARDIARRIETEMEYPGQIKVNLVRESRAVDYAK